MDFIKAMMPLSIPVAIISVIYLYMKAQTKLSSISSSKDSLNQGRINGLLVLSAPLFTACMGIICILSGENINLLKLGANLGLVSAILFLAGSVILSRACRRELEGLYEHPEEDPLTYSHGETVDYRRPIEPK